MYTPLHDDGIHLPDGRANDFPSGHTNPKAPAHAKILCDVFDALGSSESWITDRSRREAAQRLSEMTAQVRDGGSDNTFGAFLRLREAADTYSSAPSLYRLGDQFQALEGFLLAMRADFGHSDRCLARAAELDRFVSDIGGYLTQSGIADCGS
jgi:hypothetical protein